MSSRKTVPERLSDKIREIADDNIWKKIFQDIKFPSISSSQKIKAEWTKKVLDRMEENIDSKTCADILSSELHPYSKSGIKKARAQYLASESIDEFLKLRHKQLVETLTKMLKEEKKFYGDPISVESIEYVKNTPSCEAGVREGNLIFLTKIPFRVINYLQEEDDTLKRYYSCQCPFARESIMIPDEQVSATFCKCSAGWYKQLWSGIFDQPVAVDVIESVLKGDFQCRFAVHIPKEELEKMK